MEWWQALNEASPAARWITGVLAAAVIPTIGLFVKRKPRRDRIRERLDSLLDQMWKVPPNSHAEKVLLHHIDYTSAQLADYDRRYDNQESTWVFFVVPFFSFMSAMIIVGSTANGATVGPLIFAFVLGGLAHFMLHYRTSRQRKAGVREEGHIPTVPDADFASSPRVTTPSRRTAFDKAFRRLVRGAGTVTEPGTVRSGPFAPSLPVRGRSSRRPG
jgi:hypothetical protein